MRSTILFSIFALLFLASCAGDSSKQASNDNTVVSESESTNTESTNTDSFGNDFSVIDAHGNVIAGADTQGVDTADLTPGSEGDFVFYVGNRVLFAVNTHSLTQAARIVLRRQAQWLKKNSDAIAVIEGHADERGTREYNIALGARRASAVRDFLVAEGVASSRLDTLSYGKERAAFFGSTEAIWAENRRAVTNLN